MKVIVSHSDLSNAVLAVSTVIPTRATQPVLTNILLSGDESRLTIIGTDKEQTLFVSIPAEVPIPGSFAVPAKKLSEILRQINDCDLELSVENFRMTVKFENQWVRLPGIAAEDFPKTDLLKSPEKSFELDTKLLAELMELTTYSMATEITRINLAGVLWQLFPDEIRMVATDGHLLALVKRAMKTGFDKPFEMLIPERAATRLQSILAKSPSDKVEITPGEGSVQFSLGSYRFQSKLITEKFPDYERVLPLENEIIMLADTNELIHRTQLMDVVSSPITHLVKFSISKGMLELSAMDLDTGAEGNAPLSVDYDGEPMDIGFNAKMLLNILHHIPSEQVRFAMHNSSVACLITPVPQPENFEYLTVLMPLHLPDF